MQKKCPAPAIAHWLKHARNSLFFCRVYLNGHDAEASCKAIPYRGGGASLTEFLGEFGFSTDERKPTMHSSPNRFNKGGDKEEKQQTQKQQTYFGSNRAILNTK
ncbi:MAG: hypothetical protein IPP88_21100 [Betaproteobacteria bacterium]|nr:hypothetical protein [Betaproteobacteria bacterium]